MEKVKTGFVYKIISPNNKIYIGITENLKVRISKYRNLNCKNQKRLYASLQKYGWDNHVFEVLEEVSLDILKDSEVKWIKFFNSFKTGLNCILGGDGNLGREISRETRIKMSNSKIGIKQSVETIEKRIIKTKGKRELKSLKLH